MISQSRKLVAFGLSCLFTLASFSQSNFDVEVPTLEAVAGVPFTVQVRAIDHHGQLNPSFNGRLAVRGYRRERPKVVISEISADGETVEFINPGSEMIDLRGWELEAIQQPRTPERLVRQTITSLNLESGKVFVWTSRTNSPLGYVTLRSPATFNEVVRVTAFQIRDPAGKVIDQVWLGDASGHRTERLWNGQTLQLRPPMSEAWLRVGRANRYGLPDWTRGPASIGAANSGLELPWSGNRIPATVEPAEIQLNEGVWTGAVVFAEAASSVNLAVGSLGGPLVESSNFAVLPVPRDLLTGTLPRLRLSLPPNSVTTDLLENEPENHRLIVSSSVVLNSNLVVRLVSDTPREIEVDEQIVLSAGVAPEASATFTNFDDTIADGPASVTLTAFAPGFLPGQLALVNRDNELGRLLLRLPPVAAEESGFQTEPGRLILSEPAAHGIQVNLRANGLLQVPPPVVIPAGAAEVTFPFRVGGDSWVNIAGRTAQMTAEIEGWPPAVAELIVRDDESAAATVVWPNELVEGVPAEGSVSLQIARDHDVTLLFQSDSVRFPTPAPVTIPAGTRTKNLPLLVPDNSITDGPFSAQICVSLNETWIDCRRLSIADDEVAPLTRLEFQPPEAVFSGQPFAMQAFAFDENSVPQRTNFSGLVSLGVSPDLATVQPNSNPLRFTNGIYEGQITLTGVALDVQLQLEAAGLRQVSRPLDLIAGFQQIGPITDLAAIPGRGSLLVSHGYVDDAELREIDPQTGAVERRMGLPDSVSRIAVAADGSVAWLASSAGRLLRIDLPTWSLTDEFPLDPNSGERIAYGLTVLPGGAERVVALVAPLLPTDQSAEIVAYDRGIRLPQPQPIEAGTALNDVQPGRTADEAFVGTLGKLTRIRVSANGVEILATGVGVSDVSRSPNFVVEGDQIFTGEGRVLSADTFERLAEFIPAGWPGWQDLALVVPFADQNRIGFVSSLSHFQVFDLTSRTLLGTHALPTQPWGSNIEPGRLVRCGERRIAQLLDQGGHLRVWECPWLTEGTADLQVIVEGPRTVSLTPSEPWYVTPAQWQQKILVTNQGPSTAHGIVLNFSDEPAVLLGSLGAGESRVLERNRTGGQPEIIRHEFRVDSGTSDPTPADNVARTETAVLAATRSGARALALAMNHLVASPSGDRLYVALSRQPNSDSPAVAVVNPENAQIEKLIPVGGEPKRLAISVDSQWLWAIVGSNQVARWNLTDDRLESPIEFTDNEVLDLLALPAPDGRLAVATRTSVQIFEGTALRGSAPATLSDRRYLGFSAGRLWEVRPGEIRSYEVAKFSLTQFGAPIPLTLGTDYYRFGADSRRLYFAGAMLDTLSDRFEPGVAGDLFLPEESRSVVYATLGGAIRRYRLNTLEYEGDEAIPALQVNGADDLVRWGVDGLAMRFATQLVIYSTLLVPEGVSDLALRVAVTQPLLAYEPFTAAVIVTNHGPDVARRLQIWLRPDEVIQDRVLEPREAISFGGSWFLEVTNLAPGAEVQLSITGRLPSGRLGFAANVLSASWDPNRADNSATFSDSVRLPITDLAITSLTLPERVESGEPFEAQVVVTNRGPEAVRGVELDLSRRVGLQLIEASGGTISTDCCDGFFIVYSPEVLESGNSRHFTLRLVAAQAGPLVISTTAAAALEDSETENNAATQLVLVATDFSDEIPVFSASRLTWSDRRQQFAASVDGQAILVSRNLHLEQVLPIPFQPVGFAFSSDGQHLWAASSASRVVRIELSSGQIDLEFSVEENLYPPTGTFVIVPAEPDLLVAAGLGGDGRTQVTVYDRGVPRTVRYQDVHQQGGGIHLAIQSEGRVYVSTGTELRELAINPNGLREVRNLDSGAAFSAGTVSLSGNLLFYGTGAATDLTSGSRIEPGILAGDAITSYGYQTTLDTGFGIGNLTIQAIDLTTEQPLWRRHVIITNGYSGQVIPMGTNGILFTADPLRLIPAPEPDTRSTELEILASLSGPVLGANQHLTVDLILTNRSLWAATNLVVEVLTSPGVILEPGSLNALRLNLGALIRGTNLSFAIRTIADGPQFIRVTASSDLPESTPADNSVELNFATPPRPLLSLGDQTAGENSLGFPSPLIQASLTSPAVNDFEVEYTIELITAQANDLNTSIATFRFRQGETRAALNLIRDDGTREPTETFRLRFASGPVTPTSPSAMITIQDDDLANLRLGLAPPFFEGNSGITELRLPVLLVQPSSLPVEVSFRLIPETALAGSDFLSRSGRLHFPPGIQTNFISIPVVGDTMYEPGETLRVELDDLSGAWFLNSALQLFIRNDDLPPSPIAELTAASGSLWHVKFDTVAGARYRLQTRTNLHEGSWETLSDVQIGSGEPITWEVSADSAAARWFRVLAE